MEAATGPTDAEILAAIRRGVVDLRPGEVAPERIEPASKLFYASDAELDAGAHVIGLDSLDILELLIIVEESLDLSMRDEMNLDELTSVGDLVALFRDAPRERSLHA